MSRGRVPASVLSSDSCTLECRCIDTLHQCTIHYTAAAQCSTVPTAALFGLILLKSLRPRESAATRAETGLRRVLREGAALRGLICCLPAAGDDLGRTTGLTGAPFVALHSSLASPSDAAKGRLDNCGPYMECRNEAPPVITCTPPTELRV